MGVEWNVIWKNMGVTFWLVLVAALHQISCLHDHPSLNPVDANSFHFTLPLYNVSIMENAVGKTYVIPEVKMGIYISDPTLEVRYRVISGDSNKFFKAESKLVGDFSFLRIRTRTGIHKVINRERNDEYTLIVKGIVKFNDGTMLSAQTQIFVTVKDANDLSPLFYPTRYSLSVPENEPLHKSIAQVSASDADIGVNGDIYYSFKQKTETFAIHPSSGVVTLTRPLSYIEQNNYEFDILAEDRGPTLGSSSRVSKAKLQVRVLEVNFYAPEIKLQELPAVVENGPVSTIYAILYVHDKDYGDNGAIKSVEIIDGDPNGYFTLVKENKDMEYTIQVAKMLDREKMPSGFNLTIQATDRGSPPKSTTKIVHVKLADMNDHAPVFAKSMYTFHIEESAPVHTPLGFVRANDTDMGKNAEVIYAISGGNELGWFSINKLTGLVSVASLMDTETRKQVLLQVSAQDRANAGSRRVSHAQVKIKVLDCNDNPPIFNASSEPVFIQESRPIGTVVYQVSATDKDQGDNSYISYSIANIDDTPFTIDHFTGIITVKQMLDYESMKRVYRLQVRASDWGAPFKRESEMILEVRMKDINDNKPKFEKVDCKGYLSREAPIGTQLVTISAIDFDIGNIISYRILSGNEDGCFDINPTNGMLKLNCDLQGYEGNFRSLSITAFDDRNYADPTTVNITLVNNNRNRQLANNDVKLTCKETDVTDELSQLILRAEENNLEVSNEEKVIQEHNTFIMNTNAPEFSSLTPTVISIKEGLEIGHQILKFTATDLDKGYNGKLQYVVSGGNDGGIFRVETESGELTVMSNIDRETQDHYALNVTVSDMGIPSLSATTLLKIVIEDVNDFAPKFEKPEYSIRISENIAVNTTILNVVAHDKDLGENAAVRYHIISDTDSFHIDAVTGIIMVTKQLDREHEDKYELYVQATDGVKDNPLSSVTKVWVEVDDVNDNAPMFMPENYKVRIREDLPIGTVVLIINAYDPDLNGGGTVRYSLTDGMDESFEIDRQTGTIRIIKALDFEIQSFYNITARARDRGEPNLFVKCSITIEIVDVNENLFPPFFSDFVFRGSVMERWPVNSTVMQIVALDDDRQNPFASVRDYQIQYSIRDGSGLGRFTIDHQGIIRTNEILDRETSPYYWLTVYAQDRGTIPLSSWVEVLVEVGDQNDNIPQTLEPVYNPSVEENSPPGTVVLQLKATDFDDNKNNQITYDITSGNPQGFFHIDRLTGLITTTKRKLDRERQDEHILEITVSDNGSPTLQSTTRVIVTITDVNDESPKFPEQIYHVRVPEMASGTEDVVLYTVVAHDKDLGSNADIDYSIKSGKGNGRFKIHPKTGVIYSQKDFELDATYQLTIEAVDNGRPDQRRDSARLQLTVVGRPILSPHPPSFMEENVVRHVMENDAVGHMVCLMTAEDEDSDKLWYSITDGNEDNKFTIDTENGNILLAGGLDWETKKEYNLTVAVSDTINRAYTWVQVNVLDINDNRPEFTQSIYHVNISENTAPETNILTVYATDKDEDKRLFYTLHSSTDQASRNKFKINSETGVITTIDTLNREAIAQHELTIMVRDEGKISKRGLARVVIQIEDHNDHYPEFLARSFEGRVFETASVGTSIVQVMAIDRDKGENAELKYSILSGNVGNAFTVNPILGVISLKKPLDVDTQSDYALTIRATDGGSPSLSRDVNVHIMVTVSDSAPPKFDTNEYTTEIEENKPAGTFVLAVSATSRSSVTYAIIKGNQKGFFDINPNSGVISTADILDYEANSFFNLTVRATNMVATTTETVVLLHVIDDNDNRPYFLQEQYVGNISEAALVGSVVLDINNSPLVVKASDDDTNLNALLIYTIVESNAQEVFGIDANTGAIKTHVQLDHEQMSLYEFTVQVTDMGTPRQTAMVAAKVVIYVWDVNDSPPEFLHSEYDAVVLLPTYNEVAVVTVQAEDKDSGINSPLEYSIKHGDNDHHFVIDPLTGVITVVEEADILMDYDLTVSVSDGTFETNTNVHVRVEITQDSGLKFSEEIYYAEMEENRVGNKPVSVVQTIGQDLNEHLLFAILNPSDMFTMGETSGVVMSNGLPFDRELRDSYLLVVEVRDTREPPRVAHALLNVTILDTNDNVPIFVNQPYYSIVSIDAQKGDVVKQVSAIDKDVGKNGEIQYDLVSGGDGKFRVHKKTGEIIVKRPLEFEDQNKEYTLVISAEDKGENVHKTLVNVPIKIMNKATPIFEKQYYTVSVPEDIIVNGALANVEAKSPNGRKLIYSITDGNIYSEFAVDFNIGSITVLDNLDYETRKEYNLTVRAADMHTGSFATAIVNIRLEDVNDNAPSFTSLKYMRSVSEAVPIGTSILTVSATDADSGLNAQVHYHITPINEISTDSSFFHIDSQKGIILTKQKLDHEAKTKLEFNVLATDNGMPPLTSAVRVVVIVTDLNDNAPKFDQPSYDVTITDLVGRGQFVAIVTASDADSSNSGNLAYSIVGGNKKQAFMIDEHSGKISLSSLRTPDLQPSYLLNISVTDGVFTNFARVKVSVKNSNNHAPAFEQSIYDVDVAENMPAGEFVSKVVAEDDDEGKYGQISYDIESEDLKELFVMDETTGEITTKVILDREDESLYRIPVIARDGGGRSGYTMIHVNVADQGDNKPMFKVNEYKANLYAESKIDTVVLQVSAIDTDLGTNADLAYAIYNGDGTDAASVFSIDEKTGVIRLKESVADMQNFLIQFFVRAADQGSPPTDNDASVEVYIMGSQDYPPSFLQEMYTYFIPEDSAVGKAIATVTAESNDTLTYDIVPGNLKYTNNPVKFGVDDEGKITIIDGLDREATEAFELTIRASTRTSPPLVAYTHVTIKIMDINDNHPHFQSDPYIVSIAENAEIGSRVIQVIADDKDSGANAEVSYEFGPSYSSLSNVFFIDSRTGWITSLVNLDRETTETFVFEVVAKDRGPQKQLSDTTTIRITVTDHNDSPPIFSEDSYQGAVNEDALPGTVILMVSSYDKDVEENAEVTYYITEGDPLGQFNIRATGELYVNKILDRETTAHYSLTVSATDGAFVTTTTVDLAILDANDNAPVCEKPIYVPAQSESLPVGSFIAKVIATDEDEAGTRNAHLEYSITGHGTHMFTIDREGGIITTAKLLDREMEQEYQLTVVASDGGGKTCTCEVDITLSDVNDYAPEFTMAQYTVAIPEDAIVNTLLTRVSASDNDLGINRKVKYGLMSKDGGEHFHIDPVSGIVSLLKPLDREIRAKYNLTIFAQDQGTPQMTSVAHLVVLLLDVNDNPPEFERATYTKTISESVRMGTSIMRVFATSKDTGVNAEIKYSIIGGNSDLKFRVDSHTGVLTCINPLDYENTREYFLTIEASDGGTPSLSNTAVINLNITDANDNPPVFGQTSYSASVMEDGKPGDNIIQVQASDLDSLPNAALTYIIMNGDSEDQFSINVNDGFISVAKALDRETVESYVLEIECTDSGEPAMTGTVMVHIEVMDANDNQPLFSENNYTAVIQEDTEIGYNIIQLVVLDADINPNGPPFSFDIIEGNPDNEFHIDDKHGILSTTAHFDRQIKDNYVLTVRVFDNGAPPLYSDTTVTVKIIEESANPPIVTPLSITATAYNDAFPGGMIGRVKAVDVDKYDSLSFQIVSGDNAHLFAIHSLDGTIMATQELDAGEYSINVSVTDGKFLRYTTVFFNVQSVTDEMAENAVVMRFENMLAEEFVTTHKAKLVKVLQGELGTREKDVHVLSVRLAPSSAKSITKRSAELPEDDNLTKRSTETSDLDVLLAVHKTGEAYYRGNALRRKLTQLSPALERQMGIKVKKIFNDVCTKDLCDEGNCVTEVLFDKDQTLTIIAGGESFVSPNYTISPRCKCRPGYGGPKCEDEMDACTPDPCPKPQICKSTDQTEYRCECPEGKTGEDCDVDIEEPCNDPRCEENKPLTFSSRSYVKWHLNDPMERHLSLTLDIKTVQSTARLMHALGRVDYSILELKDGMVQYRFDCGSGEGLVIVHDIKVNDGKWHSLVVERRGNSVEIIIDGLYNSESSAPGTNDVLNLDSKNIYFGAEVVELGLNYIDIKRGFDGCMRNIKMLGTRLPYSGANNLGAVIKFENIEFHCRKTYIPGVCSSSPCANGGDCVPLGSDNFMCNCPSHYKGTTCEIDTIPCSPNPCMNGGVCTEVGYKFKCTCAGKFTGERCEKLGFCDPSPCKHNTQCMDGANGPRCDCDNKYEGNLCESDYNECRNSPCQNGATCQNLLGAFKCVCTAETTGRFCEVADFARISSSPLNITVEEILGIAGVVLALLIIVIVSVVVVRWRRRKRRQHEQPVIDNNRDSNDFIYNVDDMKRTTKLNNTEVGPNIVQNIPPSPRNRQFPSPRPPPVPNRPVSYTPSCADSVNTLNNFDTVRNYGSAADELESVGTNHPIVIPEFLQNLDVEKSPPPRRMPPGSPNKSDSPKKQWTVGNPNIAETYQNGNSKKLNKTMPTASEQSIQLLPGSTISIAESEEDGMGANAAHGSKPAYHPKPAIHYSMRILKGYHWDTSDWAPNPGMTQLAQLPIKEVPDSPSSSQRSRDSNTHINPDEYEDFTDFPDAAYDSDFVGNESEYIVDSEYNDGEDTDGDPTADPEPPNFEQILAMQGELRFDDSYERPSHNNYNLHPNQYLPQYSLETSQNSQNEAMLNGNQEDEDDDDIIKYGFPNVLHFPGGSYSGNPEYNGDYDHSAMNTMDDGMSVSMHGYASTNASCSDISGLCEIDDSEANLSDTDSVNDKLLAKAARAHIHTDV